MLCGRVVFLPGMFPLKPLFGRSVKGRPDKVSKDPAEVIPECNVILIPLPSFAYADVFAELATTLLPLKFFFHFIEKTVHSADGLSPANQQLFGLFLNAMRGWRQPSHMQPSSSCAFSAPVRNGMMQKMKSEME